MMFCCGMVAGDEQLILSHFRLEAHKRNPTCLPAMTEVNALASLAGDTALCLLSYLDAQDLTVLQFLTTACLAWKDYNEAWKHHAMTVYTFLFNPFPRGEPSPGMEVDWQRAFRWCALEFMQATILMPVGMENSVLVPEAEVHGMQMHVIFRELSSPVPVVKSLTMALASQTINLGRYGPDFREERRSSQAAWIGHTPPSDHTVRLNAQTWLFNDLPTTSGTLDDSDMYDMDLVLEIAEGRFVNLGTFSASHIAHGDKYIQYVRCHLPLLDECFIEGYLMAQRRIPCCDIQPVLNGAKLCFMDQDRSGFQFSGFETLSLFVEPAEYDPHYTDVDRPRSFFNPRRSNGSEEMLEGLVLYLRKKGKLFSFRADDFAPKG